MCFPNSTNVPKYSSKLKLSSLYRAKLNISISYKMYKINSVKNLKQLASLGCVAFMCEMHSELFIVRVGNIFLLNCFFIRIYLVYEGYDKIFMEIYQCYNARNASAIIFNSLSQ